METPVEAGTWIFFLSGLQQTRVICVNIDIVQSNLASQPTA